MDTILLLDDDPEFRRTLENILSGKGYVVESAATVREGIAAAEHRRFGLLLTGVKLPDGEGATVLRWFAEHSPDTPALLIVPTSGAPSLGDALNAGDAGCLPKPAGDPERVGRIVRETLDRACIAREREILRQDERSRFNDYALVARDVKSLEMLDSAAAVAALEGPILIRGECGTGKELLARWIHFAGPRSARAFVTVNCGTRPACPFVAGGRIELAHLGTLFLDEVADLDAEQQRRLTALLRDKVLERPGGGAPLSVDIRVIASTCRDLKQLTAEGRFGSELCGRLYDSVIAAPPLRERRADVPALARYFLARASRELRKRELSLSEDAANYLLFYDWPGNLRELNNVMERAALICEERVEAADVAACIPLSRRHPLLWKDIERQAIEEALRMNRGNRTRAARQLGISLRTLQYRLKEWNAEAHSASGDL